jgi:hypothetical protein
MENIITIPFIERFQFSSFTLFYNGVCVQRLFNDTELMLAQLEIAKANANGYTVVWNENPNGDNIHIAINNDGELAAWPYGMADHYQRIYAELFRIRKERKSKSN